LHIRGENTHKKKERKKKNIMSSNEDYFSKQKLVPPVPVRSEKVLQLNSGSSSPTFSSQPQTDPQSVNTLTVRDLARSFEKLTGGSANGFENEKRDDLSQSSKISLSTENLDFGKKQAILIINGGQKSLKVSSPFRTNPGSSNNSFTSTGSYQSSLSSPRENPNFSSQNLQYQGSYSGRSSPIRGLDPISFSQQNIQSQPLQSNSDISRSRSSSADWLAQPSSRDFFGDGKEEIKYFSLM